MKRLKKNTRGHVRIASSNKCTGKDKEDEQGENDWSQTGGDEAKKKTVITAAVERRREKDAYR